MGHSLSADWDPETVTRTRLAADAEPSFVCCLTHDVDRLNHRLPTLRRLSSEPTRRRLGRLFGNGRPYWRIGEIRELERALGVRSSFYFLNEQSLREKGPRHWLSPRSWSLYSYYDIQSPAVAERIRTLAASEWEVGLQGSYESPLDRERLAHEKRVLEELAGRSVSGGRQHYLNGRFPESWRHHRAIGLAYDTTLGSAEEIGFAHGYDLMHPFDDEFAVVPLTMMDQAVMDGTVEAAKRACEDVLAEAERNRAVMTVDWHQRTFDPVDFPGYREVYEYVVKRALELGAWVGPAGAAYDALVEGELGTRIEPHADRKTESLTD